MFAPCNIPLDQLIERKKESIQRGKESRRKAMQCNRMQPHTAAMITRQESAELLALERLLEKELAEEAAHDGA